MENYKQAYDAANEYAEALRSANLALRDYAIEKHEALERAVRAVRVSTAIFASGTPEREQLEELERVLRKPFTARHG